MGKRSRWSERTRLLLTLELAIVFPAAALIGYNIWNLKSIQRDRAVQAAIQRDFSEVLAITEKRLNKQAFRFVAELREEFPCPTDPVEGKLDAILEEHPQLAHAVFYDQDKGLIVRSQPRLLEDPAFRSEAEEFAKQAWWIKPEAKDSVKRLHAIGQKDGAPIFFYATRVPSSESGEKGGYQNTAFFTLPKVAPERVALGAVTFDSDYLRKFFPGVLNTLLAGDLPDPQSGKNGSNPAVMMVHVKKLHEPLAASTGWDGWEPEVERNLEGAFPSLTLAIKFRGTTIEALSQKFLRNSFLIIGVLSFFMVAGVWLTYRNVYREVALARLKSDFVANVSHELRTPLSLIRLYAETLEMGRLQSPEKYQEYFRIIRKESERLSALINNILDFSRIEAGRKEYVFRETDLAELVRNTLDSYRFQIEQNGFAFEQRIADDLPPVRVDREAIARSLLNLVNNALKYSSKEKYLGVNVYRENGMVRLEVIDRGIGIPRSEQNKIFEKFYRAGDPLVHNTKGSGLGLSLVRHIVHAHGGDISVESVPGKGSKFTIALPLQFGPGGAAAA